MILGLLTQIVIVLAAARLGGALSRRLKQPAVVGEMTAGIILGQFSSGWFGSTDALTSLSQIGLILFLFLVGLQLDQGHLHTSGSLVAFTAAASIALPFALGTLLGYSLYPAVGSGSRLVFSLFIGVAISITALPVLARILKERRMEGTQVGTVAIACAAINDVSAWIILAGVLAFAHQGSGQKPLPEVLVLLVLYLVAIWYGLRKLASNWRPESLALILLALFGSSLATEWIGLHAFFGALAAGAVMPKTKDFVEPLVKRIEPLTENLLLPLFFALTGLRTQIGLVTGISLWTTLLAIVSVAVLGKLGGGMLAARWIGMPWREAATLGVLMNARGLVELIALNIGLEAGIISPTFFSMMVAMAIITTLMTSPLLNLFQSDQ